MGLKNEDIMAIISILQKGLENSEPNETEDEESNNTKIVDVGPIKKRTKKYANRFDKMSEKNMHKTDTEIDKKLWANNMPTDRSGRKYQPISVRCRVCGKEDQVSPFLIDSTDRYKCNKCSGAAG